MEVSSITKKSIFVIIFIICIFIRTESYSKYSYLYIVDAANLNFDRTKPIISVTKVENTNKINPEYANNKQTITLTIEVKERKIVQSRTKNNGNPNNNQIRFLNNWEKEVLNKAA